jgi:uncharacterized membrane-anchored protein
MNDIATADTETHSEPFQPAPLPENLAEVLRTIVEDGNTAHLEEDGATIRTGTGRPLIGCTVVNMLAMVQAGLIGGERDRVLTTRKGRYAAAHGAAKGFDDSTTDVVNHLAAFARGTIDFLEPELIEAIDSRFGWPAISRRDALEYLIGRSVVTAAEARTDV